MAGTPRKRGPIALTTTYTTDLLQGGSAFAASGGAATTFDIVRHIHVANKLANDTFRLYLGASAGNAAGTEVFFDYPVNAKLAVDYYTATKITSSDFYVGGAATTLTLTIMFEGESYAA